MRPRSVFMILTPIMSKIDTLCKSKLHVSSPIGMDSAF